MKSSRRNEGNPPRVLIVTATDRRRGAEVFTVRLGEGLTAHGWVVQAVSLTRSGDASRVDVECLTDVSSTRPGRFNLSISRALNDRIKEFEPDIVVANGGSTLRYGALATLRSSAPVVYIAIGEPGFWIRSALSRMANRWMLRRVRRVLAVCEATKLQLLDLDPSLAGRIDVTYTGVPDQMFAVGTGQDDGSLRVVMLGSLSDEKDPLLALRSVARIPNAIIRYVGTGPLMDRLRAEAQVLGMQDRMELVGVVNDVMPHLRWASILLLTSRTEGLPGAVLEAGAASVASVALDVGGVREAVRDGVSGIVVDPAENDGVVRALSQMAADPELARRMGRAARLHMKERFAMDHIISGYVARLDEVLA
jgi:glycosyltransferase involved in cell wall biosynthesis